MRQFVVSEEVREAWNFNSSMQTPKFHRSYSGCFKFGKYNLLMTAQERRLKCKIKDWTETVIYRFDELVLRTSKASRSVN